jgi:hypothetical protein
MAAKPIRRFQVANAISTAARRLAIRRLQRFSRTGSLGKTCLWRWQERFAEAGYEGLLRDKTLRSHIPPLAPRCASSQVFSSGMDASFLPPAPTGMAP